MGQKLSNKQGRELVAKGIITQDAFDAMVENGAISNSMASGEVFVSKDANGVEVIPRFSFECVIPQTKGFRTKPTKELTDFINKYEELRESYFEKKDSKYVRDARGTDNADADGSDNTEEDPDF